MDKLDAIFSPQSLAVIGASTTPGKVGHDIFVNILNGWWEWLPATIERVIAVKNRSHNPKTTDTKLQSFFFDQIGRFLASGWAET